MKPSLVIVAVTLASSLSACSVETSSCGPSGCTSSRSGSFSSQPIGGACANDGECAGSLRCDTAAPSGYCLQTSCSASTPCPGGGVCVADAQGNFCAKSCTSNNSCRQGYFCQRFRNASDGFCTYR
ncbi:MAG: hypothetical protein INH41_07170 [Myxococcaceae bacterium]|jgi:hypothetical protein|nr:hypothetical protein [Myxococcaceae bacterium]